MTDIQQSNYCSTRCAETLPRVEATLDNLEIKYQGLLQTTTANVIHLSNCIQRVEKTLETMNNTMIQGFSQVEAKFSQVEAKFSQVEANFALIEASLTRINQAQDAHGARLNSVVAFLDPANNRGM